MRDGRPVWRSGSVASDPCFHSSGRDRRSASRRFVLRLSLGEATFRRGKLDTRPTTSRRKAARAGVGLREAVSARSRSSGLAVLSYFGAGCGRGAGELSRLPAADAAECWRRRLTRRRADWPATRRAVRGLCRASALGRQESCGAALPVAGLIRRRLGLAALTQRHMARRQPQRCVRSSRRVAHRCSGCRSTGSRPRSAVRAHAKERFGWSEAAPRAPDVFLGGPGARRWPLPLGGCSRGGLCGDRSIRGPFRSALLLGLRVSADRDDRCRGRGATQLGLFLSCRRRAIVLAHPGELGSPC